MPRLAEIAELLKSGDIGLVLAYFEASGQGVVFLPVPPYADGYKVTRLELDDVQLYAEIEYTHQATTYSAAIKCIQTRNGIACTPLEPRGREQ